MLITTKLSMEPKYRTVSKIAITGVNGMLGGMLTTVLKDYQLTLWDKSTLDITDEAAVLKAVQDVKPDVIINAAAYTAVDDCEENQELANEVNGKAPSYLAAAAKSIDAFFVHYSTDYIFNGTEQDGYSEEYQEIDPINAYGESKALGEKSILKLVDDTWNKQYIVRTAWLYGPNGPNFVDTMLKLGADKDELSIVNDQHGSPTFTKDLAERTKELLLTQLPGGVYHVTNSGTCTWYEFAKEIFDYSNTSVNLNPCTSKEFPRPAARPTYSILLNTKLPEVQSWQSALHQYIDSL